jgi:hypothetical protein
MANPQNRPEANTGDVSGAAPRPPAGEPVPPPAPPAEKTVPSPPPPSTEHGPAAQKSASPGQKPPQPAKKTPAKKAPAKAAKKAQQAPAKKAPAKKASPAKATPKKAAAKNAQAAPQPSEHPPADTNGQVVAAARQAAARAKSTVETADNPAVRQSALQSAGRYPVPLAVAVAVSLLAFLLIRQLTRRGS